MCKKGKKHDFKNYRPVSIVPFSPKYLNHSSITNSTTTLNHIIYSLSANLASAREKIVNEVITAFENKNKASLLLCDLSKAFDCTSHDVLPAKLKYYGLQEATLAVIASYLNNRKQFVSGINRLSQLQEVITGVPQGSVQGPFFFIIAVYDLPLCVSNSVICYADDTTFLAEHETC